jgi:hypothetical protein
MYELMVWLDFACKYTPAGCWPRRYPTSEWRRSRAERLSARLSLAQDPGNLAQEACSVRPFEDCKTCYAVVAR